MHLQTSHGGRGSKSRPRDHKGGINYFAAENNLHSWWLRAARIDGVKASVWHQQEVMWYTLTNVRTAHMPTEAHLKRSHSFTPTLIHAQVTHWLHSHISHIHICTRTSETFTTYTPTVHTLISHVINTYLNVHLYKHISHTNIHTHNSHIYVKTHTPQAHSLTHTVHTYVQTHPSAIT